jgi:50S ribosomal protein L16 3-hydroxylase
MGTQREMEAFIDGLPDQPLVFRGSTARFGGLEKIKSFQNAEACLESAAGHSLVRVFEPGQTRGATQTAREAMESYQDGSTVYIERLERWETEVRPFRDSLARDLGVQPSEVAVECFLCGTAGAGKSVHFDPEINFLFQLKGKKRWVIVPNPLIEHPLRGHGFREDHGPLPFPHASGPCRGNPMEEATGDRFEVVLEPGDVLYLPRGHWHQTETVTPSLHVVFAVQPPPFARRITSRLESTLLRTARWRSFPLGWTHESGPVNDGHLEEIEACLAEARKELAKWTAKDLLEVWRNNVVDGRFVWNEHTLASLEERNLVLKAGEVESVFNFDPTLHEAVLWLSGRRAPFHGYEAMDRVDDRAGVALFLKRLLDSGHLERSSAVKRAPPPHPWASVSRRSQC